MHCDPHDYDHITIEEANRRFFDTPGTAERYAERPGGSECAHRLAAAMLRAYTFNEDGTVVMDFACGAGLLSRELAPYSRTIVGVDISQNMVDVYNRSAHNQGIPSDEMRAVCISELKGNDERLEGMTFDVIVCANAYHHIASIGHTTKLLATYLRPGGSLLVADLMKDDDSPRDIFPSDVQHIVAHRAGFSREEIRDAFSEAGLGDFSFVEAANARHNQLPVTFFLARGDKENVLEDGAPKH